MSGTGIARKIDELMERASGALVQMRYFEAERMALKALAMAREATDFERMSRIIMPLQEARRQRLQQALDVEGVTIVDQPVEENSVLESGCYLVRPLMVGADARRMRLAALNHDVPVLVVCREPNDQLGLVPIVAITPGKTLRAKVRPQPKKENPDQAWLVEAMEELGDASLRGIDPALEIVRRIDLLLMYLDALPEHEGLHIALEESCKEAMRGEPSKKSRSATRKRVTS